MNAMHTEPTQFHGLPAIRLHLADGSQATVTLAGAHLVSWITADGVERIYMSPNSPLESGQAIRGGVPVIFPQFTTRGKSLRHGFARVSSWEVMPASADASHLTLGLRGNGAAWNWPHDYACEMAFRLGPDALSMQLTVHNTGAQAFSFTAALHTYLQVGRLDSVELTGLQGSKYEDSMAGGVCKTDDDATLAPKEALDRIYLQTPATLQLRSALGTLALQSHGFPDSVVWNPGRAGSEAIPDLQPDAYQHFLCVEAALIVQPVEISGGATWTGSQTLRKLPG
jgi:glucose-6-phosphate 1-epimerase